MDKKQAIAKLSKLLGKRFAYRENPKAATGAAREALVPKRMEAAAALRAAKEAREARLAELIRDPEYVRLVAAHAAAAKAHDKAAGLTLARRIVVGVDDVLFFRVEAEGDNWQEVVDKVEQKRAGASKLRG